MSDLLTLPEVAGLLDCSTSTVKRRIAAGELPAFRDGRLVRVREDDFRRYIAERVMRRCARLPAGVPAGRCLPPGSKLWD